MHRLTRDDHEIRVRPGMPRPAQATTLHAQKRLLRLCRPAKGRHRRLSYRSLRARRLKYRRFPPA